MKFDKTAGHVAYNDKKHIYVNTNNKRRYISVTTLVHKYVPEFKAAYWSTYKAVKDVMENKDPDLWYKYKRQAGGWEKVVDYYNKKSSKTNKSLKNAVDLRAAWYLEQWDRTRDHACELGTAIHNELEGAAYTSQKIREDIVNYDVSQENILALQDFTTNRVYPELLIYNDEFMVAGQADKVFKHGNVVDIHDYKTCKKIDIEGFRGETLLAPFTNIPNANYWIYTLQLSMYGWMLEQLGYQVRDLKMHWIYGDDPESDVRDKVKTFDLEYMPTEVEQMMNLNIF